MNYNILKANLILLGFIDSQQNNPKMYYKQTINIYFYSNQVLITNLLPHKGRIVASYFKAYQW